VVCGAYLSYGTLYLEAFSDYVDNTDGHITFIADLMARLDENALAPPAGARVLVLGSGNGIHDPGLARFGLTIVSLDIRAEIVRLGQQQADGRISYVVADMTKPLPLAACSVDAVFNIGSSFGFEERDEDNAAIFRHAAKALKSGRPFVFEYVNGEFWRGTSLTSVFLVRPDGSSGGFITSCTTTSSTR
jgi:SAM-dependent methyltransferase